MNKIKIFVPNGGRGGKRCMPTGFFAYYQVGVAVYLFTKSEIESNTLTSLPCYLFVYKNFWKSQNDFMFCNIVYDPRSPSGV